MRRLPDAVLLDTCAAILLANGNPLASEAMAAIRHASLNQGTLVSPISAWEIGLLSRPKSRFRTGLLFLPDPKVWFARFLDRSGDQGSDVQFSDRDRRILPPGRIA